MKVFNFFRQNIFLILISIILIFINIYPQIVLEKKLGAEYKGIERIISDDENYYQARGRDIIQGHYSLGNPYIYELKTKPPIQFFIPDFLVAKSLSWAGLNIVQIFFVYDILTSFIFIFLTFYCLFYLTKSKFWSYSGTIMLAFGMFFYYYNRPISPQFVFIFFLTLFIFVYKYLEDPVQNKKFLHYSLFNFGALFYLYTYYWTFYFIFFFVAGLIFLFLKRKELAKKMFLILGSGTLIGSYYLYNSWVTSKIPEYSETLSRLGMVDSHFPSGLAMVLLGGILTACFAYIFFKKKDLSKEDIFILSGVFSGMIAVNQHIITGKNLAFTVHYFLPIFYWYVFSIIFLLQYIKWKSKVYQVVAIFFVYIGVFYISWSNIQITTHVFKYMKDFTHIKEKEIYAQRYSYIFDWLNKNTKPEDVVMSNEEISNYIVVYTDNNIFFSRLSNLHFVSDEEVFKRFYINNYFETFDRNFIIQNFPSLYGTRYSDIFGHDNQVNKVRGILGIPLIPTNLYPDFAIKFALDSFLELKSKKYKDLLTEYRLDYIVWDKNKNPNWKPDNYSFLKEVYSNQDIFVYKFQK